VATADAEQPRQQAGGHADAGEGQPRAVAAFVVGRRLHVGLGGGGRGRGPGHAHGGEQEQGGGEEHEHVPATGDRLRQERTDHRGHQPGGDGEEHGGAVDQTLARVAPRAGGGAREDRGQGRADGHDGLDPEGADAGRRQHGAAHPEGAGEHAGEETEDGREDVPQRAGIHLQEHDQEEHDGDDEGPHGDPARVHGPPSVSSNRRRRCARPSQAAKPS
jgi:hypothetical protein